MIDVPNHRPVTTKQHGYAKFLRREMTDAERALWRLLRDRRLGNVKFRRQAPLGPFIVDFVCFEHMLVIELDGGQHADAPRDAERDKHLSQKGFRVVRYWNNDVLGNREGVLTDLADRLRIAWNDPSPGSSPGINPGSEPPSPTRGEGGVAPEA